MTTSSTAASSTANTESADTFPRQNARTLRFTLGRPRTFSVSEDGRTVLYVRSASGTDRVGLLWRWTSDDGEVLLVDPTDLLSGAGEELSPEERSRRERAREAAGGVVGYSVDDAFERVAFALSGRLFVTSVADSVTTEVPVAGSVIDPRIDPTGRRVAFVSAGSLHVADVEQGSVAQVSPEESSETVSWGAADFIAAEELERTRGFWWSPDGETLLAQRTDEAPVQIWYVANPANPEVAPTPQRYPSAGTDNADVSLWLIRVDGSRTAVTLPEETEYVASVHWPSSYPPIVSTLDRAQRLLRFLEIDVASGSTTTVREVTDDCWVDIMPGAGQRDSKGRLLTIEVADGDYALLADGERLTPQGLQVRGIVTGGSDLLIQASENAGDNEVWRVTDTSVDRVSSTSGWHVAVTGGSTVVMVSADLDHTLPTSTITSGAVSFSIPTFTDEPLIQPRVTLLPGDADRPRIAVLFPERWEAGSGQLPVLLDPYGGPHFASVMQFQGAFRESQWFANQGFAVVVVDGRGTPGAPAWERAVHGDFAGPVLEDQVQGLHAAAHAFPELDLSKVAMRGWSFGGYLSAMAVIDRPDVFHAAVAGAPVTDQRLYDTGYTERYLGLPQSSPESYDKSSLLVRAQSLSRPLQLIHGFADDNVFVAHTMKLSQVLTENGRPHEVIPLTGITHMATQEEVAENLLLLQVDFLRRALDLT